MKVQIDLQNCYDEKGITKIPTTEAIKMLKDAAEIIKQDEHAEIGQGFDGVATMEVYPPELDSDFVKYVWFGHWLGAMRLLDDAFYCIG